MEQKGQEVKPTVDQSGFPVGELTGDFRADIQNIAKESGLTVGFEGDQVDIKSLQSEPEPSATDAGEAEPEATQEPEEDKSEAVAEADKSDKSEADDKEEKPEVPEKFQDKDGKLDETRLEKSTLSAKEALAQYEALERELKSKMTSVDQLKRGQTQPRQEETPTIEAPPLQGDRVQQMAQQIEAEIKQNGAGVTLAKLMMAVEQSASQSAREGYEGLAEKQARQEKKEQLEEIAKSDPWVFTQDGIKAITEALAERPYLQSGPTPYQDAYEIVARKFNRPVSGGQVKEPTPTREGAIKTPPSKARRETQKAPDVDMTSKAGIDAFLNKLSPEQQEKWFQSQGLPGFNS